MRSSGSLVTLHHAESDNYIDIAIGAADLYLVCFSALSTNWTTVYILCIPETQFLMRRKLIWVCYSTCDVCASGRRTTPSLNKFYSRLVSYKTPDWILAEAKKTSTELEYFKSSSAEARICNLNHFNQILYHYTALSLLQLFIKLNIF
jgi:hypothetical protein